MPGPVPGIHVLAASAQEDVDGRDEPWTSPAMTKKRITFMHFQLS